MAPKFGILYPKSVGGCRGYNPRWFPEVTRNLTMAKQYHLCSLAAYMGTLLHESHSIHLLVNLNFKKPSCLLSAYSTVVCILLLRVCLGTMVVNRLWIVNTEHFHKSSCLASRYAWFSHYQRKLPERVSFGVRKPSI